MANRNNAAMAPELFSSLRGWNIRFALCDAAYDSEQICKTMEKVSIFLFLRLTAVIVERKDAYGLVNPVFLKTRFGKWMFGLRSSIERIYNHLKINVG